MFILKILLRFYLWSSITLSVKDLKKNLWIYFEIYLHDKSAEGRSRTDTGSLPPVFETGVSTNSTTPASYQEMEAQKLPEHCYEINSFEP